MLALSQDGNTCLFHLAFTVPHSLCDRFLLDFKPRQCFTTCRLPEDGGYKYTIRHAVKEYHELSANFQQNKYGIFQQCEWLDCLSTLSSDWQILLPDKWKTTFFVFCFETYLILTRKIHTNISECSLIYYAKVLNQLYISDIFSCSTFRPYFKLHITKHKSHRSIFTLPQLYYYLHHRGILIVKFKKNSG